MNKIFLATVAGLASITAPVTAHAVGLMCSPATQIVCTVLGLTVCRRTGCP
jgi:hypothetical protein